MSRPEERSPGRPQPEAPREGAWGAAGIALLLGIFVLAVLATLHSLLVTLG